MKCPNCQFENPDGAVFCAKCATKLETGASGMGAKIAVTRTLETKPEGLGKGKLFAGRFELIEELGAGAWGGSTGPMIKRSARVGARFSF